MEINKFKRGVSMYLERLVRVVQDRDKVINAIKVLQKEAEMLLQQKSMLDGKAEILAEISGKSDEELQKEVLEFIKAEQEELNESKINSSNTDTIPSELCDNEVTTDRDSGEDSDADCVGTSTPAS